MSKRRRDRSKKEEKVKESPKASQEKKGLGAVIKEKLSS
jgi:hypothetical protein